jgi:hypothetical protein
VRTAWHRAWACLRRDEQYAMLVCMIILLLCAGQTYARWRAAPPLPPLFVAVPPEAVK